MPIIRDNVDIDTLIDEKVVDMNKTTLTDSEVVQYSTIDLRHQHLKIFSLLTTSDKEINLRMYPDEHVQNMAKNHSWIYPYAKPLNLDHVSKAASNGRFLDAWYVNHKELTPQYGLTDCPQAVIDEFKKRGAFDGEGTGSNIGMIETSNLDCKKKIIDGTYLTTSQGAYTETLTCNICGNSYYDWGSCRHSRGSTYPIFSEDGKTIKEMKRCVPFTGSLDALEDSVVGTPANDTSTLLVFDTKKNRVVNMDNIAEYSDIFNVLENNNTGTNNSSTVNTGDNKNIQEPIEDSKKAGLTQKQIEDIAKMLKEGKPVPASILNNDSKVSEIQTENIEDNKNTQGGEMPYNRKNATAKKVFKDSVKSLGLNCADKTTEYFEKLTDEEIDVVMSFLDFVEDNKEVSVEPQTAPQTTPVVNSKQIEPTATETTVVDDKQAEPTNKIEDSEEFKAMQAELQKAKDELAKLKGIDNTIPNLSQISDNNSQAQNNKVKKFNF